MKRCLLTDGRGIPLGVAVDGANLHDCKLVQATLASQVLERPDCDWVLQTYAWTEGSASTSSVSLWRSGVTRPTSARGKK